MDKLEKEFIYKQLTYVKEQLQYQQETVEALLNTQNKLLDLLEQQAKMISQMNSPEFAKKQADMARAVDIAEKIAMMRRITKNQKG